MYNAAPEDERTDGRGRITEACGNRAWYTARKAKPKPSTRHVCNRVNGRVSVANSYSRRDREFVQTAAMLFPSEITQGSRDV